MYVFLCVCVCVWYFVIDNIFRQIAFTCSSFVASMIVQGATCPARPPTLLPALTCQWVTKLLTSPQFCILYLTSYHFLTIYITFLTFYITSPRFYIFNFKTPPHSPCPHDMKRLRKVSMENWNCSNRMKLKSFLLKTKIFWKSKNLKIYIKYKFYIFGRFLSISESFTMVIFCQDHSFANEILEKRRRTRPK